MRGITIMPDNGSALEGQVLECAARTDVGLVRSRNEDSIWVDAGLGWLLLADGMGGHSSGDVASALAVSHMREYLLGAVTENNAPDIRRADLLARGVVSANDTIRAAAAGATGVDVMGSTFVGALLCPGEIAYVYVGDSRLYLLREGTLRQLSHDHTMVQEFVDAGRISAERAQNHPYRGLLTRGLGVHDDVEPGVGNCELQAGDRLLLCSDGLTDMVTEAEIAVLLGADSGAEEIAGSLIEAAKCNGGRDNISVIVAWFVA
jgi:protein phosphatase